jgi:hypothetical protein
MHIFRDEVPISKEKRFEDQEKACKALTISAMRLREP